VDSKLIPADVGREVWRNAGDRCQCMRRSCHGGPGRCATQLNSGEGRLFRMDPGRPDTPDNCILLCLRCLKNTAEQGKPS
jgi:hypothetical protein